MKNPFTRIEFLWIIIIVMLGVNMAWTASLIDPVHQIAQNQLTIGKIGIGQNERIIDILTNGTDNTTKNIVANIIRNNTS